MTTVSRYGGKTLFDLLVIMGIWAFATAMNLDKAYHIDDAYHLEAAQGIAMAPNDPMGVEINWDNNSRPMYRYNTPPAYFYGLALAGRWFGYGERPMHLFQSIFVMIALMAFYYAGRKVAPDHALYITALLGLSPAFVINQNLMIDIPLLSVHILLLAWLVSDSRKQKWLWYLLAAILVSVSIFIKYTSLPLIVLLLIIPLLRSERRYMVVSVIPMIFLGLWSLWTQEVYGMSHLFGNASYDLSVGDLFTRSIAMCLCLGAVAPFAAAFSGKILGTSMLWIWSAGSAVMVATFLLWHQGVLSHVTMHWTLWVIFLGNGLLFLIPILRQLRRLDRFDLEPVVLNRILLCWIILMSVFIVVAAPFMATRHVLLILPPVLLLLVRSTDHSTTGMKWAAILGTVLLTVLLGVSDNINAAYYRRAAQEVMLNSERPGTTWSVGHWGWKWYSKQAGMVEYHTDLSVVAIGDHIVAPRNIPQQRLNSALDLVEVERLIKELDPFCYVSTGVHNSFYRSDHLLPPWTFSKAPIDTIVIYKVVDNKLEIQAFDP